jgi:hypothetical protein
MKGTGNFIHSFRQNIVSAIKVMKSIDEAEVDDD